MTCVIVKNHISQVILVLCPSEELLGSSQTALRRMSSRLNRRRILTLNWIIFTGFTPCPVRLFPSWQAPYLPSLARKASSQVGAPPLETVSAPFCLWRRRQRRPYHTLVRVGKCSEPPAKLLRSFLYVSLYSAPGLRISLLKIRWLISRSSPPTVDGYGYSSRRLSSAALMLLDVKFPYRDIPQDIFTKYFAYALNILSP